MTERKDQFRFEPWQTNNSHFWVWVGRELLACVIKNSDDTWSPDADSREKFPTVQDAIGRDIALSWNNSNL